MANAKTGRLYGLNGSGRAPRALTADKVPAEKDGTIPPYTPYAWTVPGAVDAWFELHHRFHVMSTDLWGAVPAGPHMDGAFDKMLVKLRMSPDFPLRLLSPYKGFTDDDYRTFRRLLEERYPEFLQ